MKNFWNRPWFVRIVSLLLAILIVIYIDSTQTGFLTQGENNVTKQTATQTQSVKVPLQVSVDTNQYYVVGYPEKVKVTLEGSNALVTSTINTQNFRAYIDLTDKKVGEHRVRVQISGLNKQLSYSVDPKYIKVNIQRLKSRTMPVEIEYNKNAVASGYHLGKASVNPEQVEVTGALSEVNRIDRIVARVSLPNNINHNYERQVMLVAEDKWRHQLNVVVQPSSARVDLPISISKKTVKLNLNSENEESNKIYSVTAKQNDIVIYVYKTELEKIDNVKLNVDLRHVSSSTTKTYQLKLPKGVVRAEPNSVVIQIKVKDTSNSKES